MANLEVDCGNHPFVYALGNKGAALLARELDVPLTTVDWTSKNREVKGLFLEHTLMVARFFILVRLACQRVSGVEFIEPEEIIDRRPRLPGRQEKALSWPVKVNKK